MKVKRRLVEMLQILISLLLIVLLTFSVWFLFRGKNQLPIEGAPEITFWEFIDQVYIIQKADSSIDGVQIAHSPCRLEMLRLLPMNLLNSWNFARASYFAEEGLQVPSGFLAAQQRKDFILPVQKINLVQTADAFWSHFFTFYWKKFSEEKRTSVCAFRSNSKENDEEIHLIPATGSSGSRPPTTTQIQNPSFITRKNFIGKSVVIAGTEGLGLRIKYKPGLESFYLKVMEEGQVLRIIDGPIDQDGYTWWQVQSLEDAEITGWCKGNYLELP